MDPHYAYNAERLRNLVSQLDPPALVVSGSAEPVASTCGINSRTQQRIYDPVGVLSVARNDPGKGHTR